MKRLFIILTLLSFYTFSFAQYSWENMTDAKMGIRFGIGGSSLSGINHLNGGYMPGTDIAVSNYKSQYGLAWDIALVFQNTFDNKVFFQTEGGFSKKGSRLKGAYVEDSYTQIKRIDLYYGNFSAYLGKKILFNEFSAVAIGGGMYASMDATGNSLKYAGEKIYDDYIETKMFDIGLSVMAAIEYKRMQFSLNYYHGLAKVIEDNHPIRNREIKLGITYFFF